jgi:hypothetical protein
VKAADSTLKNDEVVTSIEETVKSTIEIQPAYGSVEYSRVIAEGVRFLIAFGVALAGLLSGALSQLGRLDFVLATIAIVHSASEPTL